MFGSLDIQAGFPHRKVRNIKFRYSIHVLISNLFLQEETLRLRKNVRQQQQEAETPTIPLSAFTNEDTSQMPPLTLIYVIVALIIGIILGKFLL